MWGTDAIWYGSPEPQIMAMRTFEITPQFQETYTYPALTDEVKAGLFGLNAAKLFGVDADGDPVRADPGSADRQHLGGGRSCATRARCRRRGSRNGPTTRRQVLDWLGSSATKLGAVLTLPPSAVLRRCESTAGTTGRMLRVDAVPVAAPAGARLG